MKRIGKKLRLETETVAVLRDANLEQVNGGAFYTGCDSGCGQCGTGGGRTFPTGGPPITRPPIGGPITDRLTTGGGLTGQLTRATIAR